MPRLRMGLGWLARIENWTAIVAVGFVVWFVIQWAGLGLGFARTTPAPATVVRDLYQAAQDADEERLLSLLTPEARQTARAVGPAALADTMRELSRDHRASSVEALRARIYGGVSVASAVVHLPGGDQDFVVEELERVGGQWRVRWPLGATDWREAIARYDPAGRYAPLSN